ncbi:MAG: signal peptide peptidase SppA [Smithellaceae bacterium]
MKKSMIFVSVVCALLLLNACSAPRLNLFDTAPKPLQEYTLEGTGKDKILLIPLNGLISDMPKRGLFGASPSLVEQIVILLNKAQADPQIKALLLKVNSSGGTITASDILYQELSAYKAKTGNKVSVIMMDVAASGAYYLSLPADMIMAHPTTITGSVGVILLRPKVNQLMDKVGFNVEITKFGSHKDMGSPYRPTSSDEKFLMQKTVDAFGNRFVNLVSRHRNLDDQALKEVATGRVFIADEALQLKLIDKIGYIRDAVRETKKIAGLSDDARIVVYRRKDMPEENFYRTAQAASDTASISLLNIDLPDILSAGAGFYYLWPGGLHSD